MCCERGCSKFTDSYPDDAENQWKFERVKAASEGLQDHETYA